MHGHLLVSISSIFDDTRRQAQHLIKELDALEIPASLLVAPHIDGHWHLAEDDKTRGWLHEQRGLGRALILNGFDQSVQGRRAEFSQLEAHEARLRITGATRQLAPLGLDFDVFAAPRWRMSSGTLEVLPEFGFKLAGTTRGVVDLSSGQLHSARTLSIGEGFGSKKWWRTNIIRNAERSALRGNTVRLSISGRTLRDRKVAADFLRAAERAALAGARPADYSVFLTTQA